MSATVDLGALPLVESLLDDDEIVIARVGAPKKVRGKSLGKSGGSLPVTGGLVMDGDRNTAPVVHNLNGLEISARGFSMLFTVVVPPKTRIKAAGRGIGGISKSDPASTLNESISLIIKGTNSLGDASVPAGSLVVKATTAAGTDVDMVVPGFCDNYAGQSVTILVVRGARPTDFPAWVYINGNEAASTSGTINEWGQIFTNGFFWYGCQSAGRQWKGKILRAGVCSDALTAADAAAFAAPDPIQTEGVAWGTIISNRNSDFASYSGVTWNDWTGDGAAYSESGGGTITPTAGGANSWATGQVNGTAAVGRMRVTAKATAGKCRFNGNFGTRGYEYFVKIKARCASGTARPIHVGFGRDDSATSQDANSGAAIVFTPTDTLTEYTGVISMQGTAPFAVGLQNDADANGAVYEFDDITLVRRGWAVWADMDAGDGFTVPNPGNPAYDGVIPAGSAVRWANPKRNAATVIRQAADKAVSSANTGTTLVDTDLAFRLAAGARYVFDMEVIFTLAGVASGFKFNLPAPSGATGVASAVVLNNTANSINDIAAVLAFPVLEQGSLGAAGTHILRLRGTVENGATEGPVTLQFAQFVSDAGALTLEQGSWAKFTRVP